ncbi:MAG: phasin family protein [Thermodesulfovibrionales bacterium]
MSVIDIFRSAMLAGLGMQEKVKEFVDELVKKGELSESQGAKIVKEWTEKAEKNTEDISKSLNEVVTKAMDKIRLSTKEDLEAVSAKVAELAARLEKIEKPKE